MSYYLIADFRAGLDAQRLIEAAPAGALRELRGGFVTSGAEVQKLRAFEPVPAMQEALLDADANGGWAGPIRTGGDAICFIGKGPRPTAMPAAVKDVPILWARIETTEGDVAGIASSDLFRSDLYAAVRLTTPEGAEIVRHFFGAPGGTLVEVKDANGGPLTAPVVLTLASKVFRAEGNILAFSAVNDPTDNAIGGATDTAGLIDITGAQGAIGVIRGLGVYLNRLAVFGTHGVQVWTVDPDPSPERTFLWQVIGGLGLISSRSLTTYDDGDVLCLTRAGVRSLRTQTMSNYASVDDLGSPIDALVQECLLTGGATVGGLAELVGRDIDLLDPPPEWSIHALVEPRAGQFWLVIGARIFMFSRSTAARVRAWSDALLPSHRRGPLGYIRGAAQVSGALFFAAANAEVFVFGGGGTPVYDEEPLVVTTPFLSMDSPATHKTFKGLDIVARGRWDVEVGFDPAKPFHFTHVAQIDGTSTRLAAVPLAGKGTHLSVRLTSRDASTIAAVSQVAVHYSGGAKN